MKSPFDEKDAAKLLADHQPSVSLPPKKQPKSVALKIIAAIELTGWFTNAPKQEIDIRI